MGIFNKGSHLAIGFVVGWLLRRRPAAAITIAGVFGLYQVVERAAKDDQAYPEIREFGIGLGAGLAAEAALPGDLRGRVRRYVRDRIDSWTDAIGSAISPQEPTEDRLVSITVNDTDVRVRGGVQMIERIAHDAREQGANIPEYFRLRRAMTGGFSRELYDPVNVVDGDVYIATEERE